MHDLQLVGSGHASGRCLRLRLNLQVEDFLLLAAEHREDTMRWQLVQRLAEIEIVLELLSLRLLALADGGPHASFRPHRLAQCALQVGVLVKALGQDGARALERGRDVGDALLGIDERRSSSQRIVLRLCQQHLGKRLEPRLLGDLRLGAPLRLVGRIDVFQTPLGVGGEDRGFERRIELALLANRIENGLPSLLELAQIGQPLLERAKLRIIERAGQFLAIACDERNRGAAIEQTYRGLDLLVLDAELACDLSGDVSHTKILLNRGAGGRRLWTSPAD